MTPSDELNEAPIGEVNAARVKKESDMFKVASLIWIMLATTLGGMAVTAIIATPSLAEQAAILIPAAFVTAVLLAMPLSYLIAKRIQASTRRA